LILTIYSEGLPNFHKRVKDMAQPHEIDPKVLLDFYNNPNTQSEAVHYINYIKRYDKSQDGDLLVKANNIAFNMADKIPYDEISLDGKITKSPNDIMLVTCLYLSELGLIPN